MNLQPPHVCQKLLLDALRDWQVGRPQIVRLDGYSFDNLSADDLRKDYKTHSKDHIWLIDEFIALNSYNIDPTQVHLDWLKYSKTHPGGMDDYLDRALGKASMRNVFGDVDGIQFVPGHVLRDIFREGRWPKFREDYPQSKGLLTISCPAFSEDGTRALMSISQQQGPLHGRSATYLFAFKRNRWRWIRAYQSVVC